MSIELSTYLSEMNNVYDEAMSNIQKQKEENPSLKFFTLLKNNNEKTNKYISHLSFGANLSNDADNEKAFRETFKRHTDFMNFVLSL